ncbi:MAG: hypothetical protein WCY01_11505 [Alkalispirochaeta sp.]
MTKTQHLITKIDQLESESVATFEKIEQLRQSLSDSYGSGGDSAKTLAELRDAEAQHTAMVESLKRLDKKLHDVSVAENAEKRSELKRETECPVAR